MFVDIAFNCTSDEYAGELPAVMKRARESHVLPIITGISIESSLEAIKVARIYNTGCFFGIHPLHLADDSEEGVPGSGMARRSGLREAFQKAYSEYPEWIVGVGECGLDFFRSDEKCKQIDMLKEHINLITEYDMPCFFHCRSAHSEMISYVSGLGLRGVVHSFDGTLEEARLFLEKGFYIGLNGCSLRSDHSIEVVRSIPLDRILLETDSPYCMVRKSYAASGYTGVIKPIIRGKNEPCYTRNIAAAVAAIKNVSFVELEETVLRNTLSLFPKLERYVAKWESAPQEGCCDSVYG